MRTVLVACLALLSGGPWSLNGQELPDDPQATLVVSTPGYAFHVDVWANLHDYLYWRAQDGGPATEGEGCVAARPGAERAGWEEAEEYYDLEIKERHWRRDPLMRAVRYTLSGLARHNDSVTAPVFARLRRAEAVYRACFWDRQQEAARLRLAELLPHLVALGPSAQRRLEVYYDAPWPSGIHVDVVPYASYAGANTAAGRGVPPHMQISSTDPDIAGLSGLELLLHEASHQIFGIGRGLVGETIHAVSADLGVDPPRDLWHAVSFFTTGYVMEEVTGESGLDYTPYWVRTGLMRRAWPEYEEPIRRHWTRYLQGEARVDEAMRGVITAIVADRQGS